MSVARTAMAHSDSPLMAADRFALIAAREIARSLERQHTEAPDMWRSRLGGVLVRAVFAGIGSGHAALVVRTIAVSSEGLVQELGPQPVIPVAVPRVLVFCEKAAEQMRANLSWKSLDPGPLAYKLIRGAVAPAGGIHEENALDISVIRVDKNGSKWLNRGACADEAVTSTAGPADRVQ